MLEKLPQYFWHDNCSNCKKTLLRSETGMNHPPRSSLYKIKIFNQWCEKNKHAHRTRTCSISLTVNKIFETILETLEKRDILQKPELELKPLMR